MRTARSPRWEETGPRGRVHGSTKAAGKKQAHGRAIEGRNVRVGGDRARSCPATDEALVREADDGAESGERDRAKGHEALEPDCAQRVRQGVDWHFEPSVGSLIEIREAEIVRALRPAEDHSNAAIEVSCIVRK